MSHAFKKVPARISYVAAVTKHGDHWLLGVPPKCWPNEQTFDWREHLSMRLMEQGVKARVSETVVDGPGIVTSFDYPPIPIRSMDWSAHREDYDGAEDSHCPIGHGRTVFLAIADLLEQEET
jgi:hypothetical protein